MVEELTRRFGGCKCGQVSYEVDGEPLKVGLCHCSDCRSETGSAFLYYGDWPLDRFSVTGDYRTYEGLLPGLRLEALSSLR